MSEANSTETTCSDLRPCPFCGYDKPTPFKDDGWEGPLHSVHCAGCLCRGPLRYSSTDAMAVWNTEATTVKPVDASGSTHDLYDRDDGLAHCKVCGGAEASLTTDCPKRMLTEGDQEQVMAGEIDFIAGKWTSKNAEVKHETK